MKVAIISCSKNKRNYRCRAFEMYDSSALFRKTLEYCKRKDYEKIFIASAKYGCLSLDDEIDPYNFQLKEMPINDRKLWSEKFKDSIPLDKEIHLFCGSLYTNTLMSIFPNSVNILKGLGIGQRLQFLNQ